jgi:type I restriction enzyme S subunit
MEKQMNIPQLRFPEFNESWKEEKMGELYSFKVTNSFSRDQLNYEEGTVMNIHYGDIHTKFQTLFDITKETVPFINSDISIHRISEDNYCQEGDLILADASEDINDVGKSIEVFNLNNEKLLSGLHTILARPNLEKLDIGFGGFLFKSNKVRTKIQKVAQGSKVLSISATRLTNISLDFPSKDEQKKIVECFSSIDEKIQALKKKHILLEQYKKGVMQKLFSRELRFKDDKGFEFPNWKEKKLSSILVERNIQEPKSKEYPLMAFIAYKGVTPKGERYNREFLVSDGENKKYKKTELGDFIYSSNNLETGSIGLNNYGSASISPVYSIFEIKEECSKKFIESYFTRKEFISKMIKYRQGVIYGQWRIHESAFLNIKEYIPSLDEQKKIAYFLESLDNKIKHTQTLIENMEVWKNGLMQKMFC